MREEAQEVQDRWLEGSIVELEYARGRASLGVDIANLKPEDIGLIFDEEDEESR